MTTEPLRLAEQATARGQWRVAAALWRELAGRDDAPPGAWEACVEAALRAGDFDLAIHGRVQLEARGALPAPLAAAFAEVEPIRAARKDWRARRAAGTLPTNPAVRARELLALRMFDDAIAAALEIEDDDGAAALIDQARRALGLGPVRDGVEVDPQRDAEGRA